MNQRSLLRDQPTTQPTQPTHPHTPGPCEVRPLVGSLVQHQLIAPRCWPGRIFLAGFKDTQIENKPHMDEYWIARSPPSASQRRQRHQAKKEGARWVVSQRRTGNRR